MQDKLIRFYQGEKGKTRLAALQRQLNRKILSTVRPTEKTLIWSVIPDMTGGEFCPFEENKRPPYGNGALDRVIILHCFDATSEPAGLMAEATRMVRDHGLIEVIGWTKPAYDHTLPIWARERRRIALRWCDCWSLKWRRYEKVQDLLTLTFEGGLVSIKDKVKVPAAIPAPRQST